MARHTHNITIQQFFNNLYIIRQSYNATSRYMIYCMYKKGDDILLYVYFVPPLPVTRVAFICIIHVKTTKSD